MEPSIGLSGTAYRARLAEGLAHRDATRDIQTPTNELPRPFMRAASAGVIARFDSVRTDRPISVQPQPSDCTATVSPGSAPVDIERAGLRIPRSRATYTLFVRSGRIDGCQMNAVA